MKAMAQNEGNAHIIEFIFRLAVGALGIICIAIAAMLAVSGVGTLSSPMVGVCALFCFYGAVKPPQKLLDFIAGMRLLK